MLSGSLQLRVVIHAPLTPSPSRIMIVRGAGAVFYGPTSSADPQGVGPAQNWYVVADGVNDKFHYEFGLKGEYGAPSQLDGHVPQVYATWVNGLTPGRYYARAWVFRYVQTGLDGSTFQEYASKYLRTSGLATSRYHWTYASAAGSTRQFTSTTTQEHSWPVQSVRVPCSSWHSNMMRLQASCTLTTKLLACVDRFDRAATTMLLDRFMDRTMVRAMLSSRSSGSMILGWDRITVFRRERTNPKFRR